MGNLYPDKRPEWCPHQECQYLRRMTDRGCVGELPDPEPHGAGENTHRWCLRGAKDDGEWVFDLQVNKSDVDWFRWLFDAIDGKNTSWLSTDDPTTHASD